MMGDQPINGETADERSRQQKTGATDLRRFRGPQRDNLAEDASWVVTGQYSWSHEFRGRDAIQNGLMGHFRSFFAERPRTLAFNFIADGDYVAVEARGDNVTKAGLRYDNQYCLVFRIENGKIKQIKEYCDSTLVERVLGPFPEARKLAAV
jgi:ketosteroid isomerase-like protein